MTTDILYTIPRPWTVTTCVPNERETHILGGDQAHSIAGFDPAQTLRTRARRQGMVWLVRSETELRYPRADGTTGSFYPDVLLALDVDLDDREPYDVQAVRKPPSLVAEIICGTEPDRRGWAACRAPAPPRRSETAAGRGGPGRAILLPVGAARAIRRS
jgi:hypothetical protein